MLAVGMGTLSGAWRAAIAEWLEYARCQGLASTTLTTRRQHLERDGRTLGEADPWAVTASALVAWFAAQDWATETRRGHRATLRAFYGWGADQGLVEVSPALALPRVRPSPPRPRPTPDLAYRMALASATRPQRLMLRLSAEVGLRRSEVAQVHSRDLVEDLAGWSLVVHGKGGKERFLPLPDGLAFELRACGPGYLFPGADNGHLSPRWVGTTVGRLLPDGYTMHTLRHRFASRVWETSSDLFVIQELLGHASPVTTRSYVAIRDEKLRAAVVAASTTLVAVPDAS